MEAEQESQDIPNEVAFSAETGDDDLPNPKSMATKAADESESQLSASTYSYISRPRGWTSDYWKFYRIFDPKKHPELKNHAECIHCKRIICFEKGRVGVKKHMLSKHLDKIKEIEAKEMKRKQLPSIAERLGAKRKQSTSERREDILATTVAWVVEENIPFTAVEKKSFRCMMEITSGEQNKPEFFTAANIRDDIKELGGVVKEAVKRELTGKFFSVTTDHWTSPNNETYSCLMAHWIQDGLMKQCVLAFEVFHGTTAGSELGKDFVTKFEEYGFELSFVIAVVTDTTGNMNTFGEYLRQKNVTHLYCVDHNLHLTA
jgi:hypothetical protein